MFELILENLSKGAKNCFLRSEKEKKGENGVRRITRKITFSLLLWRGNAI